MSITYIGLSVELNGLNLLSNVDMEALRKQVEKAIRVVHPAGGYENSVVVHIVDKLGSGYEDDFDDRPTLSTPP